MFFECNCITKTILIHFFDNYMVLFIKYYYYFLRKYAVIMIFLVKNFFSTISHFFNKFNIAVFKIVFVIFFVITKRRIIYNINIKCCWFFWFFRFFIFIVFRFPLRNKFFIKFSYFIHFPF